MDSRVKTKGMKFGGQKEGVDYIMKAYNVPYRKALSLYYKAQYQLAQKTNLHISDFRAFQRYVARSVEGTTSVKSNINRASGTVSLSNVGPDDIFKSEVQFRLNNFMQKYAGTDIVKVYEAYMNNTVYTGKMGKYSGKQITYGLLKDAIEDFKRDSYEYMVGS